jgi:hypothetical protein
VISGRRLGAPVITSLIAVALFGCGSHKAAKQRTSPQLPAADRRAYVEIATDSGTLRVSVVRAALGRSAAVDTAAIAAARRRLALARPRDALLARLKAQLVAACSEVIAHAGPHTGVQPAAKKALTATDKVNAGLRQYAARHPAVAGLIPD